MSALRVIFLPWMVIEPSAPMAIEELPALIVAGLPAGTVASNFSLPSTIWC